MKRIVVEIVRMYETLKVTILTFKRREKVIVCK